MLKAQIRKRLGELSLSIDLSVAKGITVLRGESGSGKTTIANLLSGALKPSVEDNIRFPQTAGRRRPRVDFAEVVEILGLERLLHRHPGSLSGGEGQRVALARALMGTESLLILDEPLSSLDPERRSLLMGFIERAAQTLDVPILYITHSEEEMRRLARRAFLLQSGRLREMDLRTAASHN